jgi:glycosyltransferase involved in cell wall biosynthesis
MALSATQSLVSVVVPVYNGAPFIAECLDSVISQAYQNWECIIVDNASTDDTGQIAHAYAERDSRIRTVTNPRTVPIIQNFNIAVRQASEDSEYTQVLCADDWLFPQCIELKVDLAERHPTVGLIGSYAQWGSEVWLDGLPFPSPVMPGPRMIRWALMNERNVFGPPTAVLFRTECVRSKAEFFDEGELHADITSCFEVLRNWDFGFVHQVLTFVRRHEASNTSTVCDRLFTYKPLKVILLERYGPEVLDAQDLESCRAGTLGRYYAFLGKQLTRRPCHREFWRYHEAALRRASLPFSRRKILTACVAYVARLLLNPESTLRRGLRHRRV